jgi:hypothetical protein
MLGIRLPTFALSSSSNVFRMGSGPRVWPTCSMRPSFQPCRYVACLRIVISCQGLVGSLQAMMTGQRYRAAQGNEKSSEQCWLKRRQRLDRVGGCDENACPQELTAARSPLAALGDRSVSVYDYSTILRRKASFVQVFETRLLSSAAKGLCVSIAPQPLSENSLACTVSIKRLGRKHQHNGSWPGMCR